MNMTRSMLQQVVTVLALAFVLSVRADDSKVAELRENKPSVNMTFKDSTTEGNEKFVRRMTVKILGGDVLKRVKDVTNDPNGSAWTTGDWTKNESTSVTYTGVQKKDPEPNKRYAPYFSGTAGPKDEEGQGPGDGAGGEDPNWDWSVLAEYNITGVRMREKGAQKKAISEAFLTDERFVSFFEKTIGKGITIDKKDEERIYKLIKYLKDYIDKFLADNPGHEDASMWQGVLQGALDTAVGQAIDYANLPQKAKELLTEIEGRVPTLTAEYNKKVMEQLKEIAKELKNKIDETISPHVLATGYYYYDKGARQEGQPGWKDLQVKPASKELTAIGGKFALKIKCEIGGAFGPYASVKPEVTGEASFKATFSVTDTTFPPSQMHQPTILATTTPIITLERNSWVLVGIGLELGLGSASQAWYYILPEPFYPGHDMSWKMSADPITAEEVD